MNFFTTRNLVILALTQTGVIVAGILAAGACHRWYSQSAFAPPSGVTILSEYGFLALAFPLAWIVAALAIRQRHPETAVAGVVVFLAGFFLVLLLLLGIWYAVVHPWLRLLG
jgi:hypothetical protein